MLLHFLTDDTKVAVDVARDGVDWRLLIEGAEVPLQAYRDRTGWFFATGRYTPCACTIPNTPRMITSPGGDPT